jgi:hypothetical protein
MSSFYIYQFSIFAQMIYPRTMEVQLLKDILNAKYDESTSSSATPVGGDASGGAAADETVATEEVASAGVASEDAEVVASEEEGAETELAGEGVLEHAEEIAADVVTEGTAPSSGSSSMDLMETLPLTYPAEEVVEQEWPPCPWIPKTSLRRWRQPKPPLTTSVEETSYACFMVFPCNLLYS